MAYEAGMLLEAMIKGILDGELDEKISDVRRDKGWDEFYLTFQQKPDLFLTFLLRNGWVASQLQPRPEENTIQYYINWKTGEKTARYFPPNPTGKASGIYNVPMIGTSNELDLKRKLG